MKLFALLVSLGGALCYLPSGKDGILSGLFLRDLVDRINGKGVSDGDGVSYLDFTDGLPPLDAERLFPMEYDALDAAEPSDRMGPSLRDQEYLRHSSLWGKQYIPGGSGEGNQLLRPEGMKTNQETKTDSTLPAYCNPPNPCPVGYSEEQGCIEVFENSATFSRQYQAAQDCMCDNEHMFECPDSGGMSEGDSIDLMDDFGFNVLQQSLKSKKTNPFLMGEKLPVAAKKGIIVPF